jgi:adenylyltransferase/sulfurtransferase
VVDLSNLSRQILHHTQDIGKKKVQSAEETLRELNPDVHVEAIAETITQDNAFQLSEGCNLILDATDNFPDRYALNKAALQRGIPFLYGGVYGIEGMTTTIIPGKTACLRCIFPEPPPTTVSPILGVAPGIIGCLQALEAIKYLVGIGELLANRLLIFDGFGLKFREVGLTRYPQCPDCSL